MSSARARTLDDYFGRSRGERIFITLVFDLEESELECKMNLRDSVFVLVGWVGLCLVSATLATVAARILTIWDGARPHRASMVREYLDSLEGHIHMTFLPPYCPELNPVEYLWAWLKRHAIANFCPDNLNELQTTARNKLKSAQHRPSIIAACWVQATLW